jgi:hypothetical protein
VALCRRLDGLPLALELAAARTRAMTPAEILERLDAGLPLTAPSKSPASARHRSLAAVVDWSYDLLDEPARTVYERLGVAAGGVLLEAAEAICTAGPVGRDDVAAVLDALVDRSLVMVSEHNGRTRYAMLDTLRADALRRLTARGNTEAARDRHADHFAAVSDRIRQAYSTAVPAVWVAWLGDDVHNVRSALRWCLERDASPDRAFRLTGALWSLCFEGHARSVADIVEETLRRWPPHTHPLGPEVAGVGAVAYLVVDDPADARRLADTACHAAAGSAWPPPTLALRVLAELAVWHDGDVERGLSLLAEARDAADRSENAVAATDVEHVRLMAVAQTGDLEAARALAEQLHARAAGTSAFESLYARLVQCLLISPDDVATAAAMLDATLAEEDVAATSLGRMLADLTSARSARWRAGARRLHRPSPRRSTTGSAPVPAGSG